MRRTVVCAVLTAMFMQGLSAGAPKPPVAGDAVPATATAVSAPEAIARATGRRTEVMAERSESRQVFANPDGTYTLEQALEPVRVRRGSGWVDVDKTVQKRPDGSVGPKATVTPVTFSRGGDEPLVEFGAGEDRLVLRWPAPLPEPELDGSTATYADVLPDVDLEMEALTQGFGYALVVRTPQAAASPALAEVDFLVDRAGLGVRRGDKGGLAAVARDGGEVFRAPNVSVWDTTEGGDAGSHRGLAEVVLSDGRITVRPDRAVLTDTEAEFPIQIAAQWAQLGQFGWTSVYEQFPDQTYWNGANMGDDKRARVGYSNHEPQTVTVRSFFHFDLRGLRDKHVLAAELNLLGGYSAACGNSSFWLGHAGPVDGNTTWRNQPGVGKVQHKHESGFSWGGCSPRWVGWDVTDEVSYSNARTDSVTFRLSGEEGNPNAWRKFDTTSYGQHPKLLVNYNRYPWTPVNLTAAPKPGCGAAPPNEPFVTTNTPVLKADAADPDGDRLTAVFRIYRHGTAEYRDLHVGQHESGSQFQVAVPGDMFKTGETLGWYAATYDGYGAWSGWAGPCFISVDTLPPDRKPSVTSTDYPEGTSAGAPGKSGRFTFGAAGLPDAAGFQYRVGGQGWRTVAAVGGSATVDITPVTADGTRLDVAIVDKAGNVGLDDELDPAASNVRKYEIRVNPPTLPTGHWRLDGYHTATDVPDVTGKHPGSFAPGAAQWAFGRSAEALSFTGNLGSEVSTRNGPAVDATRSFTVSAWVKLRGDPGDQWKTAVSQDGERVSRFALQYAGGGIRKWAFSMMTEDSDTPQIQQAVPTDARFAPRVGVWTHLTGVYNSTYGTLQLYVDGELAGTGQHTGRWTSRPERGLQIGRGKWAGNLGDNWPGELDDVKVFDRALPDIRLNPGAASEIDELAGRPADEVATWNFDEGAGAVTTDFSGTQTAATLVGAGWAQGKAGKGLRIGSAGGRMTTSGPLVRTVDSYTVSAWVKLDTAPTTQQTVLSQESAANSGFTLLATHTGKWAFTMRFTDQTAAPNQYAVVSTEPVRPEWTHVTGVYDATNTEIRIYVNGVQSGGTVNAPAVPLDATGPFHVGGQKIDGAWRGAFVGTVDEVRAYNGVRTPGEILEEAANPVPSRVRGNAHTRYVSPRDQFAFTGPAPAGFHKAGDLGYYAPPGTPGTHMLYSCRTGNDGFTSPDPGCEGARLVSPLGLVHDSAGDGRLTLYGCRMGERDFDSLSSTCEGQQVHRVLGYTLPYVTLGRYQPVDGAADLRSDTGSTSLRYRFERDVIALHTGGLPGQVLLYLCQDGADTFTLTDATCGGKQVVKALGSLWTEQPLDPGAVRLYSCVRLTPAADRFESTDRFCEGQDIVGPLGYGIAPARVSK
ncbi:LamG-like jellyroll fold domain-containing protein [Actinophytocola algeriensis]|uniref:LamG-like jellyroll fold domain-containing protein n=1 Tax=Actinophytocola algeriensis TaxID=1768010 RepID=A0A7W7VFF9_9PSEU|nr:LamG-like jellyroll fold domain-containing protein [Actinophytocola algeriensis]MBB4908266.1 hypothetical protein [Actinophytocola algeriensis]MBE1480296.1 hypothetical protein [Actinophytocola algeriensis]